MNPSAHKRVRIVQEIEKAMIAMNSLYSELQWLPRSEPDFPEQLKRLENSDGPLGRGIQALALHALDLNNLTRLARIIGKLRAEGRPLDPLVPLRLAVLSNATVGLI